MLRRVCSIIDQTRRQNVVKVSATHSVIASCATFCWFLPHVRVICDQFTIETATWNLLVKWSLINNSVLLMQQYILPSNTN